MVRDIFRSGEKYTAVDAFAAQHRLQELKAVVGRLWQHMDVLVVPTIGTTFTVDEVLARPIDCNTMLGHYTHFGNLLDLLGVAVPLGVTADGRPASAMVLGPALSRRHRPATGRADPRRTPRRAPWRRAIPVPHHLRGARMTQTIAVPAEPCPFPLPAGKTALVVIDMQRDFLLPGGFGETPRQRRRPAPEGRAAAGGAARRRPRRPA